MHHHHPRSTHRRASAVPARRRPAFSIVRAVARTAAAAATLVVLTGCNAMSSPQEAGMELAVKIDTGKPIRFSKHDFGVACYDTYGCKVVYAGRVRADEPEDEKSLSTSEVEGDYRVYLQAGYLDLPNFPGPAEVSWRSADGARHQARVDFAAIFKEEVVLHRVPREQLPPFLYSPIEPGIILVVNDRTVEVYMKAHITTSVLQEPGNRYSGFRNDPVLVYSKTF